MIRNIQVEFDKLGRYTIVVTPSSGEDGCTARFMELGLTCRGHGDYAMEAIDDLCKSAVALVEAMAEEDDTLPEPSDGAFLPPDALKRLAERHGFCAGCGRDLKMDDRYKAMACPVCNRPFVVAEG